MKGKEVLIPNYFNIEQTTGYCVLFGNQDIGWTFELSPHETLQKFWRVALGTSGADSYGDITLYLNGELIRSCNNFRTPILYNRDLLPPYGRVWPIAYKKWKNSKVVHQNKQYD